MVWKCDRKDDDWGEDTLGMKRMRENILTYLTLRYLPRFPPFMSETTTTTNEEDNSRMMRAMSKQGNGHTCTICTVEYHRHIPTQQ